jgi:hypothetical protein
VSEAARIATVAALIFVVNLPFGYWRAGLHRRSGLWFAGIFIPVLLSAALRMSFRIGFRWENVPYFAGAFFLGQFVGGRVRRRN